MTTTSRYLTRLAFFFFTALAAAPAFALSVSLSAPAAGTVFTPGSSITISANATPTNNNRPITKVEFFADTTLIGADTISPYSIVWSNVPPGTYSLTAKATDSTGATAISAARSIRVNALPNVSLTAPANGALFTPGSTIALSAAATDSDGTISQVQFFQGATLIGSDATSPYSFSWTNVASGSYTLTAKATDNNSGVATSTAVIITVDTAPTVSISSPANSAVFTAPADITVTAAASDADGTVAKVDFFDGTTLVGTATAVPFTATLTNAALGTHSLTARATDDLGLATTSAAITVIVNAAPTVSISSPVNNALFTAPANIIVTATAADSDGTVSKVDFFDGATLVGTATAAPYTVTLANTAGGSHTLTARATDNRGAVMTSAAVTVKVDAPPTISITSPANNAVVSAPATITLTASAADADGAIAKVDFFQGATLVGTSTAAPYAATVSNLGPGSYSFTAVATDSDGVTTTSAAVSVIVNSLPIVSISSPATGGVFIGPASIAITATATDTDGTVAKVDFFDGPMLIGTATAAPYTFTLANAAAGSHTLTAQAIDNRGGATTSAAVTIRVDAGPTVSITSPTDNAIFAAPATITLTASAADADGTIAKLDFFQGTTLVGTATAAPYATTLSGLVSGAYSFTAVAADNDGATTTSAPVNVIVNSLPAVSITSPGSGTNFPSPANISITVSASDTDGTVNRVEIYASGSLITTLTAAPYSFTWANVPAGTYTLSARAFDNNNAQTSSAEVTVIVQPRAAALYFIYADHLNTSRLITDSQQREVWRWDVGEPFGNNPPNENPSGLGVFEYPGRMPGQYFDKETNLAYNVFRNYDPARGGFLESDLLGLLAGPNTYLYALASPLTGFDPLGLITCFSNPPNFSSANCFLLDKTDKDRDEFSPEEKTDEQRIGPRIRIPDYRVGVGGSRPDKKQHRGGMPIRPEIELVGYFVYESWYTQYTTNRRGVTEFTELWRCPGQNSCGPDDKITKVLTTCIGDWTPYRNRTSYWMRSYYEAVK